MRDLRIVYGGFLVAAVFCGFAAAHVGLGLLSAATLAVCGATWLAGRIAMKTATVAYGGLALGVALAPCDGLRLGPLTDGDLLIGTFGGAITLYYMYARRLRALPRWMVAGAGLIAISALLVEMFPPSALTAAIFQSRDLQTLQPVTSGNLSLAAQLLLAVFVVPAVLALVVSAAPAAARLLVNGWLAGVAASSVAGLLAAFTPLNLQATLTGTVYAIPAVNGADGRFTGLSVHPTLFGLAAVLALPIALARITDTPSAIRYGLLSAVYILAILISGSRADLAAMLLGFVLVFAWQYRSRARLVLIVAALTTAAFVSGNAAGTLSSLQRSVGSSATAATSADSDSGHVGAVSEAFHFFLARPIVGYGYQGIRGAHDLPLELLTSGGVLALIGFFLIVGGTLTTAWRLRQRLAPAARLDSVGLMSAGVAFIFTGLVANASIDRFIYVPLGLLLGLLLAIPVQATAHRLPDGGAATAEDVSAVGSEWRLA